jgi:hypothetical protein
MAGSIDPRLTLRKPAPVSWLPFKDNANGSALDPTRRRHSK